MGKSVDRQQIESSAQEWSKNISTTLVSGRSHRIVFVAVIAAMLLLVVGVFFVFQSKVTTLLTQDIEEQLMEVSLQSRNVLQFKLREATTNLYGIASAFSKYKSFENQDIRDIMEREVLRNGYNRMYITDLKGHSIAHDGRIMNIADREYFQKAAAGMDNISSVLDARFSDDKIVVFSVPIYNNQHTVVGVLSAADSLKSFEEDMSVTSYDSQCYTYICDSDGNVVVHPKSRNATMHYTNLYDALADDEGKYDGVKREIPGGRQGLGVFTQADGSRLYATYTPLEGINDWYCVSVIPYEVLTDKTSYILTLTLILLAIIAAILTVIGLYVYYVKRSSQKTFEYLAFTDEITGCRSWSKFELDVSEILRKQKDRNFAYVYQNVRNFKYINDIMGYEVGNDLLRYISKVLTDNMTADEVFARISADRFALLLEYSSDSAIIKRLEQINDEISLFRSRYDINFELRVMYGIYKIKDKTLPLNVISDRALLAMETISNVKDSNFGFYNSSIRQKALLVKELENEMQSALDDKNFIVYLQPKFDLTTKKIVGAEALVRWMHPKRGLLPPGNFIDIFENNGFITKLDHYMFEETCRLIRKWIDSGKEPVPISVNLSKVHLYNPNIAEDLYCLALRYSIPTKYIEIELTESMNFDNISMLLSVVDRLKRFDFTISIDDFGTGYSSLNLLKDLPVDVLKIDREFFADAADQKRGRQVIASIIDMAKRLDMKTVAEGVEYKEQADFLTNVNCDYVQGYYFSQPIGISEFEAKYVYNDQSKSV